MLKLLTILSCCLVGISISTLVYNKNEALEDERWEIEEENDHNPEESPVTELTVNADIPFSHVLVNYTDIGLRYQAGAINCLVVSRTDSSLILAGSQNGGVWISHNTAHSWQPVNDTARSLRVTSIAQNFFRANEFYYSTGVNITENNRLLFDIYRSVDFGQTFSNVNSVSTPRFGSVDKILPSPLDANTLYVLHNSSTSGGAVYRTIDNCTTFQLVFKSDSQIDDMILLPTGILEIGFSRSVWRSSTGDFGTFVQSTGIGTTGYNTRLAYCQSRPDIQYCSVYLFGGYDFYKSIDTGRTWTHLTKVPYGFRLAVKPDNPDFLLAGTVSPGVSQDGGLTWQSAIGGHDLRSYNFDPHRPGKVYVTSDFGISTIEVDPITANSFHVEYPADTLLFSQEAYFGDHAAAGIQTLQGYQDLGSRFIQNLTQSRYMLSGDGGWSFISKQNPDIGYFCAQYGDIYRSDQLTTTNLNIVPILNQLDADHDGYVDDGTMFIHPFVMNNADDSQLYFPTFHMLWRSTDYGNNWTPVSHSYGNEYADVTIACSDNPDPIVYWTNSDSVFVLKNAATALPLSEFGRPAPFDSWRCFTHPDNDSSLYLINRSPPYRISYCENLFDQNSIWTDIPVSMLTDVTIQCIALYPGNDQIIFVGSKEGGLYVTLDRGLTWTKEIDMPNVQINEIKIRESDKKVFIFTFGRGTWVADFESPNAVSTVHYDSNVSFYPNPFQDQITIEFERELNASVEFTDMQGRQRLKKSFSGSHVKISTEDLGPGLYVITVFSGNKIVYQANGIRISE
ncbi:MAG TPA: T9SS type A sorting domain-containing protein [Saprospiraceae bacterium]|nr:T9SS type A sorting domain-containing protein [Saprospiraceae bacterium]